MTRGLTLVVFVLCLLVSSRGLAEPVRVLVAVGHRNGLPSEAPLKHAVRDATRVRETFVRLGGVRPEHAVVLSEPTTRELYAALDGVAAKVRGRARDDVSLVFYFSGHGDRDAIHLGSERVALRDLDLKLGAVPAALRIVIADACRTADLRGKGVTSDEPFAITLGSDRDRDASGVVRVHASADGEIAQESDELGGAIFTHYWLSGLAGAADTNGDARITFEEAYAFAYDQTLFRSARASGVVQRPALEANLREGAPIVLTRTGSTSALRFPRATDGHYIVYAVGSRTVAGELWTSPERSLALAVTPGRYIIQRRAGGRSAALELHLGKDEQREVRADDFRFVPEETLARKGGELILHPNELSAGYAARTGRLYTLGHETTLRYRFGWEGFALGLGLVGGLGSRSDVQESNVAWLGADALAELRLRASPFGLRAGAGPRVVGVWQTIARLDADRLRLAGYETERRARGAAFGMQALVGARLSLFTRAWLDIELQADALGVEIANALTAVWSAGGGGALGLAF